MAGDRVREDLGVVRPIGAEGQRSCAKEGQYLQLDFGLAAVSDVDGDGIEELLWTSKTDRGAVTQSIVLTALSGRQFRHWELASHSYAGSEVFIDPKRCGRSKAKPGGPESDLCPDR